MRYEANLIPRESNRAMRYEAKPALNEKLNTMQCEPTQVSDEKPRSMRLEVKPALSEKTRAIHARALTATMNFKRAESELIDILSEMEESRGYLEFEVTSIYAYAAEVLKLSEDISYNLIAIARKSREVPALKEAIRSGTTTASKARKVISVITEENQDTWLNLLAEAPARKIEKEVARVNPKAATPEVMKYTSADRLSLHLGVSENLAEKIKRLQDLVAQKTSSTATIEDALEAAINEYLERHDPVRKAERIIARRKKMKNSEQTTKSTNEIMESKGREHHPNIESGQYALNLSTANTNAKVDRLMSGKATLNNAPDGLPLTNSKLASHATSMGPSKSEFAIQATSLRQKKSDSSIDLANSPRAKSVPETNATSVTLSKTSVTGRNSRQQTIPSKIKHQVHLRDGFQCTQVTSNGKRCTNSRYLDLHHIVPVAFGGRDVPENLVTLCWQHHRQQPQHISPRQNRENQSDTGRRRQEFENATTNHRHSDHTPFSWIHN
jgi:5-methylcytosine-specific restriction endonuclease McrA